MPPPAITVTSFRPFSRSCLMSSGISVLCPAASDEAPTTSTPLSSASTTVSSGVWNSGPDTMRSEEHTSELQSLMRISYAVFCLKKKNKSTTQVDTNRTNTFTLSQTIQTQH